MGKQINQYTKTRTAATSQAADEIDWDSSEDGGTTFESARMTRTELFALLNAELATFYSGDGAFLGVRNVEMNGFSVEFENGTIISKAKLNDVGFLLQTGAGVERGSLGYDVGLDSATLELKNTLGTYVKGIDGKLGVGTATPTAKFEVVAEDGTVQVANFIDSNANDVLTVFSERLVAPC